MKRRSVHLPKGEGGFTLIELLTVITILSILAAIAIPFLVRQREKGWVAETQSSLRNAAVSADDYAGDNGGSYVGMTVPDLRVRGFNAGPNVVIVLGSVPDATEYCLEVTHTRLPPENEWKRATFSSDEGAPSPADSCT